jgi:hypothetical protein
MSRQGKRQSGRTTAVNMAPGPCIQAPTRSARMTSSLSCPVGGPFSSALGVLSPPVASRRGTILCPVWIPFPKRLMYALTFCCVASRHHVVPGRRPFGTAWRMCSPSIMPSCDTMLYACLSLLKALPASSSPAWLKEPRPHSSRHWVIQREWAPRLRERGTEAVMPVGEQALEAATVAEEHSRACLWTR